MTGKANKLSCLAALATLISPTILAPAQAQLTSNSTDPIDITGEQFEAFQEKDYAIWTGDVHVVQGTTILTAPKLTMYGVGEGGLREIHAEGGIRYTNGEEAISSQKAIYDADQETVLFTGNVVVVQGEQVLSGGRLIYHTQTGEIKFTAADGGRVRGIFINNNASPKS